jgi:hypothetical protein
MSIYHLEATFNSDFNFSLFRMFVTIPCVASVSLQEFRYHLSVETTEIVFRLRQRGPACIEHL